MLRPILLAALLFAVPLLPVPILDAQAQTASPLTPEQRREVERLIREVLVKNPEILVEAMKALEDQQEAKSAEAAKAAIAANRKEIENDGVSFVAGNPKGDVTLVEFFDYRCGYCKQVQPSILGLLKEDAKLRVVLKELPVLGPESVAASRAAIAALEQKDKYLPFHNAMMAFRGKLDEEAILKLAKEAGLDVAKLKTDMAAPKVQQTIQRNLALAGKLGIEGTPGFIIGDRLIPGAVSADTLRKLIKDARG